MRLPISEPKANLPSYHACEGHEGHIIYMYLRI